MGALGEVQSITGVPACVRAVFREGALAKSNMSSRGWAYRSRRVRCLVMPPEEGLPEEESKYFTVDSAPSGFVGERGPAGVDYTLISSRRRFLGSIPKISTRMISMINNPTSRLTTPPTP